MPKALFAVTNIKTGSESNQQFAAGSKLNKADFTNEQLIELHDAGAIEIRVVEEDDMTAPEPPREPTSTSTPDESQPVATGVFQDAAQAENEANADGKSDAAVDGTNSAEGPEEDDSV